MKIAIVVQGRFHAFDLVRALLRRGNKVTVFSNYPQWAVARFGIPASCVRSFSLHGVLTRIAERVREKTGLSFEASLHRMFSRWAARQLRDQPWDVIHTWTGVAEEIDSDPALLDSVRFVMRGSAHIRAQADLLTEEQHRTGCPVDQPSEWMIAREQREYDLADHVMVLSTFAYKSFLDHGIPKSKLLLLPLGTQTSAFRPGMDVMDARRSRILSGARLRVLYVGGISWRKGLFDLREILRSAAGSFDFRFVGPVWPEAREAVSTLGSLAEFVSKKPQSELPAEYAWGDVFIFPTIEDGYAVVLAQASAAALPILTTTNCCGPDLIREGETGWVLPIRSPEAFLERLQWCDTHRRELADMITASYEQFQTRDWSDVAADFESLCRGNIAARAVKGSPAGVSR
jgi:glycosyltransferase involved in cell wall biosynthesis